VTRVFKSRAAAEAEGFHVRAGSPSQAYREVPVKNSPRIRLKYVGDVRTDLEAQLAKALEAVEWEGRNHAGIRVCPVCKVARDYGDTPEHAPDCKLSLALKAFRGEGERG